MSDLPIPLSRTELYLAAAAGMTGVIMPEKPESREELFLAKMAGDFDVTLPLAASLKEIWLAYICGETPNPIPEIEGAMLIGNQKVDTRYLAAAAGMDGVTLPEAPENRAEEYFVEIVKRAPLYGVLKTVSGINIALADVVRGIESLNYVYGDTTQQTYSGKNLFSGDFSQFDNTGGAGSTYAYFQLPTDGVYTLTLIAKRDFTVDRQRGLGFMNDGGQASGGYKWAFAPSTGTVVTKGSSWVARNNDNSTSTIYHFVSMYPTSQGDLEWLTNNFDIQLELGSTATSYEPYVGGIASPNPDYPQTVNVVTGTQNVWVHGKNLCPNPLEYGIYDLNGQKSGSDTGSVRSTQLLEVSPSTQYRFSCNGSAINAWVYEYDENGDYIANTRRIISAVTFTTGSSTHYIAFFKGSDTGLTGYQLEQGSAVTSYEPYQGATYTIDLTSKNLLPFTNQDFTVNNVHFYVQDGTLYANGISTGETASNNINWQNNFAFTLTAGTYTFSLNTTFTACSIKKKSDGTNLATINGDTVKTSTFTLAEDTEVYLGIYMYQLSLSNLRVLFQLEQGSTVSSYEPYYNYELCKIGTYQDYIYKSGDDWYVHKETGKYTFDGSETINYNAQGGFIMTNNDVVNTLTGIGSGVVLNGFSDKFIINTTGTTWTGEGVMGRSWAGVLWAKWSGMGTDNPTIATWLSSNRPMLYYAIVTPTDTKITDNTLIGQLDAINNAVLPKPNAGIMVSASSTNLAGEIEISYYGESE